MVKRVTNGQYIRRPHSDALKRELVERSLENAASVAASALEAGANANLLFDWRQLHLQATEVQDQPRQVPYFFSSDLSARPYSQDI